MNIRTERLTYSIDWEKEIVFKSEYAHIEEREGGLYCSLKGEFFERDMPYKPPRTYSMSEVGVTTQDFIQILTPIYHFLRLQRKGNLDVAQEINSEKQNEE